MSLFEESKSYRPFQYPYLIEAAQKHNIDLYWDIQSVDLQDDIRQYNQVNGLATPTVSHEVNKYVIDKTLPLFTEMDKTVASNYVELLPLIKNNEGRVWLLQAAQRETVHQRAYALAAETFGFSDNDWSVFSEYAEMREKIELMSSGDSIGSDNFRACKILARTLLNEGIGLFGVFSVLLNFKRFGKIIGFNDINQWSLLDEQEHVDTNIRMLMDCIKDLNKIELVELLDYIRNYVDNLVKAEHHYLELVFKIGEQEDYTLEQALDYILFLGEYRLYQLGMLERLKVRTNPLPWMDWLLSGSKHDNFFEKRVTAYTHNKLSGKVDYNRYQNH